MTRRRPCEAHLCALRDLIEVDAPLVIGGLGGSGTRLVAVLAAEMGFFLGNDLNAAYDNLWYSFLFNRKGWVSTARSSDIDRHLDLFTRAMTGPTRPGVTDLAMLLKAAGPTAFGIDARRPFKSRLYPGIRVLALLRGNRAGVDGYFGWGWKEPNSHVLLDHIARYYPKLRYVHVVRHGLDMAFSRNQNQIKRWGTHLFGLAAPPRGRVDPGLCLDYWIKANERAVRVGKDRLGDRFLVLNFDKLCTEPKSHVPAFARFLDVELTSAELARLVDIPTTPGSVGRYREHDLSVFSAEQIQAVRRAGFQVEVGNTIQSRNGLGPNPTGQ